MSRGGDIIMYGVYIRMENRISLSTVALLSTLWEEEQRDYLDILSQFVLCCLPRELDAEVDINKVTAKLRAEYGFADIPCQVVEKVLRRLTKYRQKRYLKRSNHKYIVENLYDKAAFDSTRQETNALISDVLNALAEYLEQNYLHKRINSDEATEFLFHFFEAYGLTVVHDSNLLRAITTSSGKHNFYVARFIIENFEKGTSIFDKLIKITTGFIIHKAVYFYSAEKKESIDSKLRDVNFYLDCSLVIDALGYDSASDESAFDEMNHLIRTNGGKVLVFDHTVEEASRVLEAYANRPQSYNSFALSSLAQRNYPSDLLASLALTESIAENLKKKNVFVVPAPSYEATRIVDGKAVYEGFEDEEAIENNLKRYMQKKNGILNGERLRYDAKTLSAIGRLRKNLHPTRIERCKAIVVTQGSILNKCMHELDAERFAEEIDYAINDLDLVSLLWLGQRNTQSSLPQNLLVANAVAACQVTQEIMDQAIELACRMEQDKDIPKEAALIIRSSAAIRPILFEKTKNDPTLLTEGAIKQIVSEYVSQESRESVQIAVDHAVELTTQQLKAQHSKELESAQTAQAIEERRQQANMLRSDSEATAKKWSQIASKIAGLGVLLIWVTCLAFSLWLWIEGGWIGTNLPAIGMSVLTLLQIIDYFSKIKKIKGLVSRVAAEKVFQWRYAQEIKKREKLMHISLTL